MLHVSAFVAMSSYNEKMSAFTYDRTLQETSVRILKAMPDPELSTLTIQLLESNPKKQDSKHFRMYGGSNEKDADQMQWQKA
jgi:hypothetical protein